MSVPQYFAQIDNNNVVSDIAVVTHLFMAENPERYPGTWVETFVNLPNKTYAGIGYTYDETTQNFTPPDPTIEP
jgi:hypothetical protein